MPADRARSRALESRLLLMTRATWAEIVPAAQASTIAWSVVPSWDARIPILISPLSLYPSNSHSEWRAKRVGLNELLAALPAPLFVPLSGSWVESEHAQFLVTAAGFRDARGPRDGLLARGQFEHSEAAIERGCPRIAALRNRAVGRDEHGRHVLVDAAAEDVDAGCLCFLDHDVRVVAHSFPLAVGNDHRCAGKGDQVLGHGALILWRLTAVAMRVCDLRVKLRGRAEA